MTDKIVVHPLKQFALGMFFAKHTRIALGVLLSTGVLAQPANAAEQEWWFDVEVILFERNLDVASISEKFEQSRLEQPDSDYVDLLTPYLTPDLSYLRAGLPYCRASNREAAQAEYQQGFAFPLPAGASEESDESSTPQPNEISQQNSQDTAVNSDDTFEENFQYEVVTSDVFAPADNSSTLARKTDVGHTDSNQNDNLDQPADAELAARPPIHVTFIEWQIPREFLCSYAEQIDPSFASLKFLQDEVFAAQPSDQVNRVPRLINGIEWEQKRNAFLLPAETMEMTDLYDKIKRQRDITPILHLNWRQEVKFGRDTSQTFRLFAGENYAQQFDSNGVLLIEDTDSLFNSLNQSTDEFYIPEQELAGLTPQQQQVLRARNNGNDSEAITDDLFARIDSALADDTPINIEKSDAQTEQQTAKTDSAVLKELWQLDGAVTIYLRNVGRVPYLHIDSNLDFRQPIFDPTKVPEIEDRLNTLSEQGAIAGNLIQQTDSLKLSSAQPNYLQSVNFNQLRRVISKQVHYFDHPLFGMVVRIKRFRWPEVGTTDTSQ